MPDRTSWEAFSIGEVARRAGVHETSVHRRWGVKPDLALDAVLDRTQTEIPVPDTGALRTDLSALVHAAAFVRTPLGALLVRMALREDTAEYEGARERFRNHRFAAGSAVLAVPSGGTNCTPESTSASCSRRSCAPPHAAAVDPGAAG